MHEIEESDLPGIGKRFSLGTNRGGTLTIIVHNDGRRDLYHSTEEEGEPHVFTLTDDEARKVGGILGGTYFAPTRIDQAKTEIKRDIKALKVPGGSPVAGKAISELDIRNTTGASVVSVIRNDETIRDVSGDLVVKTGDVLLVLGSNKSLKKLTRMFEPAE